MVLHHLANTGKY